MVRFDPSTNTWKLAPIDAASGTFGIALEDAEQTVGTKKVRIATGGKSTTTASGAIKAHNPVRVGGVAGQVIEFTPAGTAADIDRSVGWYVGIMSGSDLISESSSGDIPDAAQNDVVLIRLRGEAAKY